MRVWVSSSIRNAIRQVAICRHAMISFDGSWPSTITVTAAARPNAINRRNRRSTSLPKSLSANAVNTNTSSTASTMAGSSRVGMCLRNPVAAMWSRRSSMTVMSSLSSTNTDSLIPAAYG